MNFVSTTARHGRDCRAERTVIVRKTLSILTVLLLISAPALAMRTPLMTAGTPSTSVTNYAGFVSTFVATNDTNVRNISPISGSIEGLFVVANTAPGGVASYAITLQKNGSDTIATCTLTGAQVSCSSSNTFSVSAGDNFSVKVVPSGSPSSSRINISSIFNSGTGGDSILYNAADSAATTSSNHFASIGGRLRWDDADSKVTQYCSTSGTIRNLYALLTVAPGSGKSYDFTILKNSVATGVTCNVSESSTTCNDTVNSFTVVQGDLISVSSTLNNTPASTRVSLAVSFDPTVDGESMFMTQHTSAGLSNVADSFIPLMSVNNVPSTTEASNSFISPSSSIVVKKLYVATANNPGASKSYTHGVRINNTTSSVQCTRTGSSSATTCTDNTNTALFALNDIVNFVYSPSNTPTSPSTNRVSVVLYIDPSDKLYGSTIYDSTIY